MKQKIKSPVALLGAAVAFFAADKLFAQVTWNPVAVTGGPAVGVPGATYQQFHNQLALDDTGRIAFVSELAGAGVDSSNKWTLHFGQPGSAQLTARQGQPTPGASGQMIFGNFDNNPFPSLSAAGGRLAFTAASRPIADPLDSRYGVWTTTGGALQPVLPNGTLPGMRAGEVAREVDFPEVLNQDVVRVSALVTPDPVNNLTDEAVYLVPIGGPPQLIIRQGDPSPFPGADWGAPFEVSSPGRGWESGPRASALTVRLSAPGFESAGRAFLAGVPDAMTVVARTGQPAPGLPGEVFTGNNDWHVPVFHGDVSPDGGHIVFRSRLTDNRWVLYAGTPAAPQLAAVTGQSIPGVAGTLDGFQPLGVSNDGRFLAWAASTAATETLITNGPSGGDAVVPVVTLGRQAPGLPAGVEYSNYIRAEELTSHPQLGPVFTFQTALAGPGVTTENDWAYFLGRLDADPVVLAREGDPITVAPGDVRTLQGISGWTDVNAPGQIGILADFTDGSQGVFVVSVPDPGAAAVGAGALIAIALTRRRAPTPVVRNAPPSA
jgi:hypothetical protein